ncbi:octapeptide-repeat protein T2-like [Chamaea fasciata]|uniref:octapeptide-repeat protein T2-like n=1 Tax=Chamaea fasciata TaxID=190680 RepID=UPI00336A6653
MAGNVEIKPNEANIVSENRLLVTKMRRKMSCPDERGLEETEKKEGKWKRTGERGDRGKREGKGGRYHQRVRAALWACRRRGMRRLPAVPGTERAGAASQARLPRRRRRTRGEGGAGPWTESRRGWLDRQGRMRAARARTRGLSGREAVRDSGRQDKRKGEQEPARAGEPEGRLGPGQRRERGSQGAAASPSEQQR